MDYSTRAVFVQCELYHNNEVAIRQSLRMRARGKFVDPLIIDQDGGIVWSTPDLLRECDRCRETARFKAKRLRPELSKAKIKKDRPDGHLGRRDSTVAVTLTRAKILRGRLGWSDVLERPRPMSQVRQARERHIMDLWDLKKWRRKLKYSQFEAADKLGVTRAAIQNWESERSHIRLAVGLACEE